MRIFTMPEKVVSDSSPLIALYQINRFSLLEEFYEQIIIPQAVWNELIDTRAENKEFFTQLRQKGFLQIQKVPFSPTLILLKREIDEGEAEAIQLALTLKADILLVDEKEARALARTHNLTMTGVLGILMRATREKKITSLKEEIQKLEQVGFRIHPELKQKILQQHS